MKNKDEVLELLIDTIKREKEEDIFFVEFFYSNITNQLEQVSIEPDILLYKGRPFFNLRSNIFLWYCDNYSDHEYIEFVFSNDFLNITYDLNNYFTFTFFYSTNKTPILEYSIKENNKYFFFFVNLFVKELNKIENEDKEQVQKKLINNFL